ncbi:hypothetical protein [Roseovarius indicus]|uniref:hypothetical protein n=1 Tax=Roseovarius indicus TaxID=540747 RepID=UPI00405A00FB
MTPGQPITIPEGFKANDLSDEQVKAFLDDLARISLRHGVEIRGREWNRLMVIDEAGSNFSGYSAEIGHPRSNGDVTVISMSSAAREEMKLIEGANADHSVCISSIDLTKLSAHERIKIHGRQSPDLARMLQDAFMAGAEAVVEHRKDVYPEEWWWDGYEGNVEDEAPEYAAKIMGGQG